MTVVERVNANTVNGNMVMGLKGFGKSMKPKFDGGAALNEGDVIVFPTITEMEGRIGAQKFKGEQYEFIVLDVIAPDGSTRAINWFPTTFQNPVFVWAKDGSGEIYRTADVLYPEGKPVEDFLSERGNTETDTDGNVTKSDTQKGVEKLAGKKVKIDQKKIMKTVGFDKDGNQDTSKLIDKALYYYSYVA